MSSEPAPPQGSSSGAESASATAEVEALRRNEERWRLVLQSTREGVWDWDLRTDALYWSPRLKEMLGYCDDELEASWAFFRQAAHPDDLARQIEALRLHIDGKSPFYEGEFRCRHRDGSYRWFASRGLVIRDADGRPYRMVGTDADITERREAKERETQVMEALRDADRRKDQFIAVLSHELRNPLAAIRSGLQLLDMAPPGSDDARWAQGTIKSQTEHLLRLVDDLLDVTRIAQGKIHLELRDLELAALVRRTVADYHGLFRAAEVTLESPLPEQPIWVHGDPTRLAQAIGNLLQNALKFTPAGGRVTITLRQVEAHAELSVEDTGAGIEPTMVEQMFEPFAQAESTLARSQGGLGLGLALVRGIVELHRGTVTGTSEGSGRGATFAIRVPSVPPPAESASEPAPARSHVRARILLVEDNSAVAKSVSRLLELDGHEVTIAATGTAGLDLARTFEADIIVCDVGLPDMSGYQLAAMLGALPGPRPFLVALTGYASPEDSRRALEAGFDHHLGKPISLEQLRELVSQALGPRLDRR